MLSLTEREIDKDEVENAIKNPDEILNGKKGRKIAHKIKNERILRVVYEVDEKAYKVVTAHYAKRKRYMRK